MERSSGTWFVIALVLGTVAFIATLLLTPVPDNTPRPLTAAERAERVERQRVQRIVSTYDNRDRARLITDQDWPVVAERARAVLEVFPQHHWAHLDLLHAMKNTGADPEAFARRLADLDAMLVADPAPRRREMHALAARGWHDWFAGDEETARAAWHAAAELVAVANGTGNPYVEAGYRSLAGEGDAAIAAWEQALSDGWARSTNWTPNPIAYARADYDNMLLIHDPRFEAAFESWQAEHAAEQARRDDLEDEHEEAHPPIGGTPEPDPTADEDP